MSHRSAVRLASCFAVVNRVLEIMQAELKLVMGNCGTQKVADINRNYVATPHWRS